MEKNEKIKFKIVSSKNKRQVKIYSVHERNPPPLYPEASVAGKLMFIDLGQKFKSKEDFTTELKTMNCQKKIDKDTNRLIIYIQLHCFMQTNKQTCALPLWSHDSWSLVVLQFRIFGKLS